MARLAQNITTTRPGLTLEHAIGGRVAGLDEVGRGPLAGPVVACAVVLPDPLPASLADLLDDSKRLSPPRRDAAALALRRAGAELGLGAASVGEILRLTLLQASLLAMRRAFARLSAVEAALVDGNRDPGLPCLTRCVVGGDGISLSIAAASIIAKVTRDRLMVRLDARHPGYGWADNAGYGVALHMTAMHKIGITVHHRAGFAPVRALLGTD